MDNVRITLLDKIIDGIIYIAQRRGACGRNIGRIGNLGNSSIKFISFYINAVNQDFVFEIYCRTQYGDSGIVTNVIKSGINISHYCYFHKNLQLLSIP